MESRIRGFYFPVTPGASIGHSSSHKPAYTWADLHKAVISFPKGAPILDLRWYIAGIQGFQIRGQNTRPWFCSLVILDGSSIFLVLPMDASILPSGVLATVGASELVSRPSVEGIPGIPVHPPFGAEVESLWDQSLGKY